MVVSQEVNIGKKGRTREGKRERKEGRRRAQAKTKHTKSSHRAQSSP